MCLIYLLTYFHLSSQQNFNILPNVGGINGQSQAWTVLLDSNNFYVIGDLLDTLSDGSSIVLPWVSTFDYDGDLQNTKIILDEPLEYPFRVARNAIFKNKNENLLIYGSQRFSENSTHPKLIEIDQNTGKILKSIHINNPIDSSKSLTRGIMLTSDSLIILSSYYWVNNHYNLYLMFLDEDLNFEHSFILQNNELNNIVYYIEIDSNSTLTLIGDSRKASDQSNFPEIKPFISKISLEGEILYFNTVSGIFEKSLTFPIAYTSTISKDDSNNWVISCVSIVETHTCKTCNYLLPYTLSLSSGFDTLNWSIKFPSLSPQNNSQPIVASISKCTDHSGFLTAGFDKYSFIYKVNNNGDSIWSRKYIPLGWSNERAAWTELVDLKSTSHNTYILTGRASDSEQNVIRSWLIQIDSLGCIIEGCDSTVGIPLDKKDFNEYFSISPNPTSDELYILNKHLDFINCKLIISNNIGQVIKNINFESSIGEQYIISLEKMPPGIYNVSIIDNMERILTFKRIVKK